ncbi:MAG: flagellar assembly peptidoglycan hydrolase FlgJ [Gammaproteobacteria bacterium]
MYPSQQTASVYTDFHGLAALRHQAQTDKSAALRQVAEQFEALFMQMMLKSMRDATLEDGLFNSSQGEQYRDMLDSQLSLELSRGRGLGLAEAIVRQLGGGTPEPPRSEGHGRFSPQETGAVKPPPPVSAKTASEPAQLTSAPRVPDTAEIPDYTESPFAFVQHILPYARKAASLLGLGPEVLIAQAALETGWGRGVIRDAAGESSHNLFNIKADSRWDGPVVAKRTLEYVDGVAVLEQANFRRYSSPVQSFEDYVDFLRSSPRYQEALQHDGDPARFVEGLQSAGYATDPDYANKIKEIMRRPGILGEPLRVKSSVTAPIEAARTTL